MSGLPPRPDNSQPRGERGFRGRDDTRPPRGGRGRGRGRGERGYNPRFSRDTDTYRADTRDDYAPRDWQENSRSRGFGRPSFADSRPPRREERDPYYSGPSRGFDDRRDPYPPPARDFPPHRGRYDRELSPRREPMYDRRPDYRRRTPSPPRSSHPPESPSFSRGRYGAEHDRPHSRSSSRSRYPESSPIISKFQRDSYERPPADNDELEAGQVVSEPEPPSPPPPLIHRIGSPRRSPPPPHPSRLPGRRRQPARWDSPQRRRDGSPGPGPPRGPRYRPIEPMVVDYTPRSPTPPPETPAVMARKQDVEMAPPSSMPSLEPTPMLTEPEPAPAPYSAPAPSVPPNHIDVVKQAYSNHIAPVVSPDPARGPKKASWARATMVPANVYITSTTQLAEPAPPAPEPAPAPAKNEPKEEPMEVDEPPQEVQAPRAPSPPPQVPSPEPQQLPKVETSSELPPRQVSPPLPAPPSHSSKGKGRLAGPPSQPRGFTFPAQPRGPPTGPRLNRGAPSSSMASASSVPSASSVTLAGPSSLPPRPPSLPATPVLPSPIAPSPLRRDSPALFSAGPSVSFTGPPMPSAEPSMSRTGSMSVPQTPALASGSSTPVAAPAAFPGADLPAVLPVASIAKKETDMQVVPPESAAPTTEAHDVKMDDDEDLMKDPFFVHCRTYVPHAERQERKRKKLKNAHFEEPRTELDVLFDERQTQYAQLRQYQHAVARKNSEYVQSASATGGCCWSTSSRATS
ncbi:hypothetical protein BD626DRAFT_630852 [Schizophyllum amplum]|uniref:Uncharacterized protein n=1 Tax=Schizophyllum amplum TaxID=97359 RepID=A0A550CD07_9AGAR|nr:hypothetical protein BD626DRAFT_630852 [Auriculariopsis ampla]